jgi:diguanylate cyclase (GGDEF)-like protein
MLNHFVYLRILNILLGLALAGTSYYLSYHHEQDQIYRRYTAEVDAVASSLELELGRNIALLMSFRSYYEAFAHVDEKGFSIFSKNARNYNQGVYGMKYAPFISDSERPLFEAELSKGKAPIVISTRLPDGSFVPAPPSEDYFPIQLSEPAARQDLPLGYDLASTIETRTALETAASNNQAIGAKPLTITNNNKQSYIYFISLPLYNSNVETAVDNNVDSSIDDSTEIEDQQRSQLKGFVVGLYDIEAIFKSVIENAPTWDENNSIALEDNSGQSNTTLRVASLAGVDVVKNERFAYSKQLASIADLQWYLTGSPSALYFKQHRTTFPYMLSVGILLFSLMIEAYLGVLRRVDKELQDAALVDGLTCIPNRRRFFEQLNREWPRAQRYFRPVTVVIADVDNFKKYNDIYGHVRGDRCLHDVAQAMFKCIHRPGDLLARYGGEEFAIVLPETTLEAAREVADKCRQAVEDAQIEHKGNAQYGVVTVSMGVACVVPEDGLTFGELIEMADQALYESKEKGRNRVSVYRIGRNNTNHTA